MRIGLKTLTQKPTDYKEGELIIVQEGYKNRGNLYLGTSHGLFFVTSNISHGNIDNKTNTLRLYRIGDDNPYVEVNLKEYVDFLISTYNTTDQTVTGARTFVHGVAIGGAESKLLPDNGNIKTNVGFSSDKYISVRGVDVSADQQSGLDIDHLWAILQTKSDQQIHPSHLKDAYIVIGDTKIHLGEAVTKEQLANLLQTDDFVLTDGSNLPEFDQEADPWRITAQSTKYIQLIWE